MDASATFQLLGPADDASLGLFYFERDAVLDPVSRMNCSVGEPLAVGMGTLIGAGGLVVTCTHVILALGKYPGCMVTLFGATPAVCIEVQAEVCAEGWLGPDLDAYGQRSVAPFWADMWDERPATFCEDVAFLKIMPQTARWHPRGPLARLPDYPSAQAALLDMARVLPFCMAGDRNAACILTTWCVVWYMGTPDCHPVGTRLLSYDAQSFHALRLQSDQVRPGFSGSPLWDAHRRTVVGLVRRAAPALKELVLGTDARRYETHPDARATPDHRLANFAGRLLARWQAPVHDSYDDVTGEQADTRFIEPEVTRFIPHDPLGQVPAQTYYPAVSHLLSELGTVPHLVLRGAAGTGKSTLLRMLARALAKHPFAGGVRVIPLLLSAAELLGHQGDLGLYLDRLWEANQSIENIRDSAAAVLADNGAALVILLDGLDEVTTTQQSQLMVRLHVSARGGHGGRGVKGCAVENLILATVIASRPGPGIDPTAAHAMMPYVLYDLSGFNAEAIAAFCQRAFSNAAAAAQFSQELRKLRWASGRVPILQLQMAASLFQWEEYDRPLPERAVDLTAHYVDQLIDRARQEFVRRQPAGLRLRNEVSELYLPALKDILALAASATLTATGEGLDALQFQLAIDRLVASNAPAPWTVNVGALTNFLFHDFSNTTGLVSVYSPHLSSPRLEWAHRTFVETLSAAHLHKISGAEAPALSASLDAILRTGEQGYAMALLGEIDRSGATAIVARLLTRCMRVLGRASPAQLFAVRALAAGIDAKGKTRPAQVRLLIRMLLAESPQHNACSRLFETSDLPDAQEILAYPELRHDIYEAMAARFRMRLARATPHRPARVLQREDLLLQHAGMWPEFLDMGLIRPMQSPAYAPSYTIPATTDPARSRGTHGVARILLSGAGANETLMDMPAEDFMTAFAAAVRKSEWATPVTHLVDLAVVIYLQAQAKRPT